ncbi:hypothetical protein HBI56_081160 [Parastagonospora nodorum]|nr:hypothetical protein HBI27_096300 [Parastagonospora nodorum]KAH6523133.1 hypothetical protein HBI56_081160 [Parastagonospora nodorum]
MQPPITPFSGQEFARIPGFTSPSFKSFAITRAYMIKVKICIGIGGKKFEHEVKSDVEMDKIALALAM